MAFMSSDRYICKCLNLTLLIQPQEKDHKFICIQSAATVVKEWVLRMQVLYITSTGTIEYLNSDTEGYDI
jgi:hypothetical protein